MEMDTVPIHTRTRSTLSDKVVHWGILQERMMLIFMNIMSMAAEGTIIVAIDKISSSSSNSNSNIKVVINSTVVNLLQGNKVPAKEMTADITKAKTNEQCTNPHPIKTNTRARNHPATHFHQPPSLQILVMDQLILLRQGTLKGFLQMIIMNCGIRNGGCVGLPTPFLLERKQVIIRYSCVVCWCVGVHAWYHSISESVHARMRIPVCSMYFIRTVVLTLIQIVG